MGPQVELLVFQVPPEVARHWGWFLALGIGLVLLGALAIFRAVKATVVSMLFFGWLLIFAAAIEAVDAFLVGRWGGFFLHLLAAILLGVAGFLLLSRPIASAEVITLVMAMYFMVAGIFQVIMPLAVHIQGWGWQVLDGVIALLLGVLLLAQWPVSGLWVIGLFIGIDLLLRGVAWVLVALSLGTA